MSTRSGRHYKFEVAVGEAFKRKGYKRRGGNITRNGADADHVFSLPMPGFDDVSSSGRYPFAHCAGQAQNRNRRKRC